MSKRFQTTFIKVVVDEDEDDVEFFQPLTPQQSARRLMQTTLKLHKTVGLKRVPPALRERTSFSEIIRKQEKALAKLKKQIERKGSMRIRGIELAKKLRSQGIGSASNKPSSPSKETDFGEVMEHQERELTRFRGAVKDVIRKLRQKKFKTVLIPKFDKSKDDRLRKNKWQKVKIKPDIIIFEGWCVGATHQKKIELKKPQNLIEKKYDINLKWRTMVNNYIKKRYKNLFNKIDKLVYLRVPHFNYIIK